MPCECEDNRRINQVRNQAGLVGYSCLTCGNAVTREELEEMRDRDQRVLARVIERETAAVQSGLLTLEELAATQGAEVGGGTVHVFGRTAEAHDVVYADEVERWPAVDVQASEPGTIEPLRTEPVSAPARSFLDFENSILREMIEAQNLPDNFWNVRWQSPTPQAVPAQRPSNVAERTLNPEERLFMLRSVARIEAELTWLRNNNATVCRVWKEAKRAKLSDTSAAEMALICLARENEDLRRHLYGSARLGT